MTVDDPRFERWLEIVIMELRKGTCLENVGYAALCEMGKTDYRAGDFQPIKDPNKDEQYDHNVAAANHEWC